MYKIREECYYHYTEWANDQNKSCTYWEVMKLCSWKFFNLNYFCQRKVPLNFWNLKIWNFRTTSNGETFKIEVVDLEKLWNFVVYNFFIWNHIVNEIQIWISEIWNSKFVNDLEWKNSQHESYRSSKVMKLYSWQLFYLNTFEASKKQFTLGVV